MTKDQMIVVAGGGGFIGGHLVADLLRQGYTSIRSVDIKPFAQWHQRFDVVENLQLDLKDKSNCLEACDGGAEVYQLAADMGGMGFIETHKTECMLSVLTSAHMLLAARVPLLVAGTGIHTSRSHAEFRKLAEILRCPVVPSPGGRGALPDTHPQVLPFLGPGETACREADCVLTVGSAVTAPLIVAFSSGSER